MGIFDKFKQKDFSDKQYYGWKMKTSHFNPHDIVLKAIDNYVSMVVDGENQFVLLIPPKKMKKCNGMKVRQNKEGNLHFEIIQDKIYAKDNVSLEYVLTTMKEFVAKEIVPSIKDYYEYEEKIDIDSYKELSNLLIENKKSLNSLYECFQFPLTFYQNNKEIFEERGIYGDDMEEVMWFAFIDQLIKNNVAVELDYMEDVDNTLFCLNKINKNNDLVIEKALLKSNDLEDNLKLINKEWKDKNYCIAYADINSDSYILMILPKDKLKKAKDLAKNNNRRIAKI